MKGTVRSSEREGVLPNSQNQPRSHAQRHHDRHGPRDCHGCASARAEAARRNVVSAAGLSSMCQS